MAKTCKGIPGFLLDFFARREFWEYVYPEDRMKALRADLLPIDTIANRGLFIRLVGYGIIGASGRGDSEVLVRLSGHKYTFLARAAAMRLADLLQDESLTVLAKAIDTRIREGNVESFATAIRFAETRVFDVV
jgi:hypothetical protein